MPPSPAPHRPPATRAHHRHRLTPARRRRPHTPRHPHTPRRPHTPRLLVVRPTRAIPLPPPPPPPPPPSPPPPSSASPPGSPVPPSSASPAPPGPSEVGQDDTWIRPTQGAGAAGTGGGEGATGPWAPPGQPHPWDAGGQWGPPGQWGAPPMWLPPQPPRRNSPLRVLAVAAAVVIVPSVGVAVGRTSIENGTPAGSSTIGSVPSSQGSTGNSGGSAASGAAIAAKVDPGVVDVTTQLGYNGGEAAGTGMVLTSTGEVLTNNHVIDGATSISVTDVGNGKTYTATVVGTDKTNDIAVLRLAGASGA